LPWSGSPRLLPSAAVERRSRPADPAPPGSLAARRGISEFLLGLVEPARSQADDRMFESGLFTHVHGTRFLTAFRPASTGTWLFSTAARLSEGRSPVAKISESMEKGPGQNFLNEAAGRGISITLLEGRFRSLRQHCFQPARSMRRNAHSITPHGHSILTAWLEGSNHFGGPLLMTRSGDCGRSMHFAGTRQQPAANAS